MQVRIMQISQTFRKNLLVVSGGLSLLVEKILLAKLCKWIKKLTSSPAYAHENLTSLDLDFFSRPNRSTDSGKKIDFGRDCGLEPSNLSSK